MNPITLKKPLLIVAAVALTTVLSAASAFAQQATPDQFKALVPVGNASRTAVIAEALAFRGQPDPWSRFYTPVIVNAQPRAAVKAETLRAIRAHEVVNAGEFFSIGPVNADRTAVASR
jgi:hypothetical protein